MTATLSGTRYPPVGLLLRTAPRATGSRLRLMPARYPQSMLGVARDQLRRTLRERLDELSERTSEHPSSAAVDDLWGLTQQVLDTDVPDSGVLTIQPDVDGFVDLTWRHGRRSVTASTDGSGPFEIYVLDLDHPRDIEETVPDRATAFQHLVAGVRAS